MNMILPQARNALNSQCHKCALCIYVDNQIVMHLYRLNFGRAPEANISDIVTWVADSFNESTRKVRQALRFMRCIANHPAGPLAR